MPKTYLYILFAILLTGAASASYFFIAPPEEAQKKFIQADPKDYPTTGGDEISVDFGK